MITGSMHVCRSNCMVAVTSWRLQFVVELLWSLCINGETPVALCVSWQLGICCQARTAACATCCAQQPSLHVHNLAEACSFSSIWVSPSQAGEQSPWPCWDVGRSGWVWLRMLRVQMGLGHWNCHQRRTDSLLATVRVWRHCPSALANSARDIPVRS